MTLSRLFNSGCVVAGVLRDGAEPEEISWLQNQLYYLDLPCFIQLFSAANGPGKSSGPSGPLD